jgi:hypothetical protein
MLPPALGNHLIDSQSSTSPFAVNYHDCPFTLSQCAHFVEANALLGRRKFWWNRSVWKFAPEALHFKNAKLLPSPRYRNL